MWAIISNRPKIAGYFLERAKRYALHFCLLGIKVCSGIAERCRLSADASASLEDLKSQLKDISLGIVTRAQRVNTGGLFTSLDGISLRARASSDHWNESQN